MYSSAERMRAVQLYIKYDHSISAVINELGYPSHQMLLRWYREYTETETLHDTYKRKSKYTEAQKQKALDHYMNHGQCIARTARVLGYPRRYQLQGWADSSHPSRCQQKCQQSNFGMQKIIANSLIPASNPLKISAFFLHK